MTRPNTGIQATALPAARQFIALGSALLVGAALLAGTPQARADSRVAWSVSVGAPVYGPVGYAPVQYAVPVRHHVRPVRVVEQVRYAEPVRVVERVHYVQPVRVVEKVRYVQPVRVVEKVRYVKPVRHVEKVRYVKPVRHVKAVRHAQPVRYVQTVRRVQPVQYVETVRPVRYVETVRQVRPARYVESVRYVERPARAGYRDGHRHRRLQCERDGYCERRPVRHGTYAQSRGYYDGQLVAVSDRGYDRHHGYRR